MSRVRKTSAGGGKDGTRAPLRGFEHITRYWDSTHKMFAAKVRPGEYYVTCSDELITTTLGSCVAACIRDPVIGIAGMNHFLLPDSSINGRWEGTPVSTAARYGIHAMECLINEILAHGGRRANLEIKVFGGGKVLDMKIDIGQCNIIFVKNYLHAEGLPIAAEDLGGIYPRKLLYYPPSGEIRVKKLRGRSDEDIAQREREYMQTVSRKAVSGDVDLF